MTGIPPASDLVRTARFLAAGTPLAAAAIALLIVISPLSQATSVHRIVTYGPPFAGKASNATSKTTQGCGVSGSFTTHPAFAKTTGVEVLGQKSRAVSCPSVLGYNWVTTNGSAGLRTPSFTGASGLHHVVVHWKVSWSFTLTANLGPHFTGTAYSDAFVTGLLYLVDLTNGTYLLPSNSWSAATIISNGTLSANHTALVTLYLNQSLLSSHVYRILTAIYAGEGTWASSSGPSSATAVLNLVGTGGTTHLISIMRT